MTFKEMEKLLKADGWMLKGTVGSHFQYIHPTKSGKVTDRIIREIFQKVQQIRS